MIPLDTHEQRLTAFGHNFVSASQLVGNNIENVDPEYVRAMSEQVCAASGISTEYKEAVSTLFAALS